MGISGLECFALANKILLVRGWAGLLVLLPQHV
jgi:hypothetical protein